MRRSCVAVVMLLISSPAVHADAFDNYTNPLLLKCCEANGVKEVTKLTAEQLVDAAGVVPNQQAALVVVKTNDGRMSKMLVQAARKRLNDEARTLVPILLIDRFATYRPGTERAVEAQGQNVILFDSFQFSLDIGQVVPEKLGGDLRFVVKEADDKTEVYVEALGKAKLYLMTKALPEATPKKGTKFVMGDKFDPKYFAGKFKVHDDGRRSGILTLKVDDDGEISGGFVSDKDGQEYDVVGKIATPKHSIAFTVKWPRAEQTFRGWLFTGDGLAIAGTSKLQDREGGFYATRIEEE